MSRALVPVRDATLDDVPALVEMWLRVREHAAWVERLFPAPAADVVRMRLEDALRAPDRRIVLAEVDGQIAGVAVLTSDPLAPLVERAAVQVSYVLVADAFRRRGIGRSLLVAAASYAETIGADHIAVNVNPAAREANRFYARLGFKPMFVHRVAAVPGLRRRLGLDVVPAGSSGHLARRRSIRLRARARLRDAADAS